MKKYLITGVAGLLAVGVLGRFMLKGDFPLNNNSLSASENVFEFLPTTFDQLLYFSFDEQLRLAMDKIEVTTGNVGFQSLANSVDELVVIQSTDPTTPMSLMFLVNDTPIDIAALQAEGLIASDPSYITEQLATNVWVYGDAVNVHAYQSEMDEGELLESELAFSDWASDLLAGEYNVGMFSYAQPNTQVLAMNNKFIQALRWTAVSSHLGGDDAFGNVVMQFSGDVVPSPMESFEPKLTEYVSSGTVAYIEIANLVDLFGINEEQFTTVIAALFSQFGKGVYGALLSNDDYAQLYKTMKNHIAISLAQSTGSLIGMGAKIITSSPDGFPLFTKMGPMWKGLIGGTSGTVQVDEVVTENLVTYSSPEVPFSLFGQQVQIMRNEQVSSVSIGTLPTEANNALSAPDFTFEDSTIAVFMIDTSKLQQAMAMAQGIAPTDQLGVGSYLKGGTVYGNLVADDKDDQLQLSFIVK